MPFIYITGLSGSGKSTVRHELQSLGYEAYDVDEDGFRAWYNTATTTRAADQKAWEDTTIEWRKLYSLKVERAEVEQIATKAKNQDKPVFLCGTTPNDMDIWDLFDKVILLSITDETMRHRLLTRTNNDYGKHPDELKDILGWNKTVDERMAGYGAVVVDASQPLDVVVEKILDLV